jgi:hypothetical protein
MIVSLRHFLGWLVSAFRSREDLVLENLAIHQQLLALHAQRPRRRLTAMHKLFWVALRTLWSGWTKPLILCCILSSVLSLWPLILKALAPDSILARDSPVERSEWRAAGGCTHWQWLQPRVPMFG